MSAQKKTEIYRQHIANGFYMCPSCKSVHLGGLTIENLDDDSDELPQVYCPYGCGYIYLPNRNTNTPRQAWWEKHQSL